MELIKAIAEIAMWVGFGWWLYEFASTMDSIDENLKAIRKQLEERTK